MTASLAEKEVMIENEAIYQLDTRVGPSHDAAAVAVAHHAVRHGQRRAVHSNLRQVGLGRLLSSVSTRISSAVPAGERPSPLQPVDDLQFWINQRNRAS